MGDPGKTDRFTPFTTNSTSLAVLKTGSCQHLPTRTITCDKISSAAKTTGRCSRARTREAVVRNYPVHTPVQSWAPFWQIANTCPTTTYAADIDLPSEADKLASAADKQTVHEYPSMFHVYVVRVPLK